MIIKNGTIATRGFGYPIRLTWTRMPGARSLCGGIGPGGDRSDAVPRRDSPRDRIRPVCTPFCLIQMERLFLLVNHCRSEQEHLNNYTDDKGQGNLQMR